MIPSATNNKSDLRVSVLEMLGAGAGVTAELLAYNENHFDVAEDSPTLPLASEAFVEVWKSYAAQTKSRRGILAISDALIQLQFPIREGISKDPEYLRATQLGSTDQSRREAGGLSLIAPETCTIALHATSAGELPVVTAQERSDFESLVQAFAKRNEPVLIPSSMGATMVANYNNWDRIRTLRKAFETNSSGAGEWAEEFQRIRMQKGLYQDRFVLLSSGPYSGVPASDLGLAERDWLTISLCIRREHESTHYFTSRLLSSARNNLLDELIADYAGIVAAMGFLPAGWLGRFYGLNPDGEFYGGRMQNYRGRPALSDEAFRLLGKLVSSAAANLEYFDRHYFHAAKRERHTSSMILTLAELTLEELASDHAPELLQTRYERRLCGRGLERHGSAPPQRDLPGNTNS